MVSMVLAIDASHPHYSDVDALELLVMERLYGHNLSSHWIDVEVDQEEWSVHYIRTRNELLDPNKQNLVLLHGYGATSTLTWRVTIPHLLDKFNIFAIDMPGFGRSPATNKLLSSKVSSQDATQLYCECYEKVLNYYY